MRTHRTLSLLVAVAAVVAVPLVSFADSTTIADLYGADRPGATVAPLGGIGREFTPYVGSLHEHSGYSDGWAGSTPATYYASGKSFGLDFMGGADHSDFLGVPLSTSEYCIPDPGDPTSRDPQEQLADTAKCPGGDPDPVKSLTKWDATKKYAAAATTPDYGAFQGFEWSSDVYGHINVFFSKNFANGKLDGYPTPKTFYDWLVRRPELGGGSDGLMTFNHPGAKDNVKPVREAAGVASTPNTNWNDFAYDARIDDQAVGLEVYNDSQEYGTSRDTQTVPEGYYVHVLDKGWHVAPVGAEDLGHNKTDDWGGPSWAKTVILATNRSPAALKAALLARRAYAVRDRSIRVDLSVAGEMMGSRISAPSKGKLPVRATATWPGHTGLSLELVTSKGRVVATGSDELVANPAASPDDKYYFVRVKSGTQWVAYSAPVWVTAAPGAMVGEWLAGDLHVHTCYSHDAYCPREQKGGYFGDPTGTPLDAALMPVGAQPGVHEGLDGAGLGDSNTDINEAYTFGGTVTERFTEAAAKGLDFLAVTDHHSDSSPQDDGSRSVRDAGFGSSEVVGVPAYENSIKGHAQMLGATRVYPAGDQHAADVAAMADALRADGGLFQANHPADGVERQLTSCDDLSSLQWGYGDEVRVDSVEIWNIGHLLQPPTPSSMSNDDSVFFWECLLSKGWHVAATGGSDSHWMALAAVQGLGNPTTWTFAQERSAQGVLDAIKHGRTSVSLQPPLLGATQLLLEADADHDGLFESMIGDTVPPSTPMRVRAIGLPGAGFVGVRANGSDLLIGEPLAPGGTVEFTSPATAGWVRATLSVPDAQGERATTCDAPVNQALDPTGEQTTYCRNTVAEIAMTSPIYLAVPSCPGASCSHPTPAVAPAGLVLGLVGLRRLRARRA